MGPSQELSGRAVACDVLAHGSTRATAAEVAVLRQKPGTVRGTPLPAAFLKHADEQSVVGLAAVLRAVEAHHLATTDFSGWGVLAAPRYLGRSAMVTALQRFAAEGAWGVSPHLIPHRSLHAVSGTISQALKIHGPNFGVGGGPGAAGEVMLAALAMLDEGKVPGVWAVLTGWAPEPVPANGAAQDPEAVCSGLALALVPPQTAWVGPRLRMAPASRPGPEETFPPLTLESLLTALPGPGMQPDSTAWQLEGGGRVELLAAAGRRRGTACHQPHAAPGPHAAVGQGTGAGAEKQA